MRAKKTPDSVAALGGGKQLKQGLVSNSQHHTGLRDASVKTLGEGSATGCTRVAGAPVGASALPCLNSNNSTERVGKEGSVDANGSPITLGVTAYHKRAVFVLATNVKAFCDRYGLAQVGFLTLTFAENVRDFHEAQRRFNSLATHFLREQFAAYICVVECQKRGAIHYHMLVACREDIRTGFDFEGIARNDYRSASPYLRSMWGRLRKAMPAYGFGRSELLPVKTTAGGMANYCGKYLGKAVAYRHSEMGGARLVRYSDGFRSATSRFAWNSPRSRNWRKGLETFARANGVKDYAGLQNRFGKKWSYHLLKTLEAHGVENLHLADEATARDLGLEMSFRRSGGRM